MTVDDALQAALSSPEREARHTHVRAKPQRNPAFSLTSRLVVLREAPPSPAPPTVAPTRATDTYLATDTSPTRQELDTPAYTPSTREFAQHDRVQIAYESRSHWHKQRTRGELPWQPSIDHTPTDTSPPSFFSDLFSEPSIPWREPPPPRPPSTTPARPASTRPPSPQASPPSPASLRSLSPECEPADSVDKANVRLATRIEVRGWRRVGTPMHGWVVYDLHGHEIHTHKRYRAFLELVEALAHEMPQHAASLPPLPPRHPGLWQRYHPAFLEGRRRALQAWLDATAVKGPWGRSESLAAWVLAH